MHENIFLLYKYDIRYIHNILQNGINNSDSHSEPTVELVVLFRAFIFYTQKTHLH